MAVFYATLFYLSCLPQFKAGLCISKKVNYSLSLHCEKCKLWELRELYTRRLMCASDNVQQTLGRGMVS